MAPVSSVECHAGYAYPERPIAFLWQGERLEVDRVEAEWRTPDGKHFRVRTRDGRRFTLFYREFVSEWEINPV